MKGSSLSTREAEATIVKIAEKVEREHPNYMPNTVTAVVIEKLSGYPESMIRNTLDPERRAEVEARTTV